MLYRPALVRQMVLHFADLAGWEGTRYVVTLSKRTFDRVSTREGAGRVDEDAENGATLIDQRRTEPEPLPITWINPDITDVRELARICAHEALHAARPSMPHGPAFKRAIGKLLRGIEP